MRPSDDAEELGRVVALAEETSLRATSRIVRLLTERLEHVRRQRSEQLRRLEDAAFRPWCRRA